MSCGKYRLFITYKELTKVVAVQGCKKLAHLKEQDGKFEETVRNCPSGTFVLYANNPEIVYIVNQISSKVPEKLIMFVGNSFYKGCIIK